MKKLLLLTSFLLVTFMVSAKVIQISVKPSVAQLTAQVLDGGNQLSGANGVFTGQIGFLQEKTLTVKADGFETAQLFVSFKHKTDVYEVVLKPNRKKLVITTNEPNSTIFIDGQDRGKGTATETIYKGARKSIKIVADGYDTINSTISFSDSPDLTITKNYNLSPNRKYVNVAVNQIGATILANEVQVGVMGNNQPVKVVVHKDKPVKITAKCDGYLEVTRIIHFTDNSEVVNLGEMPEDKAWNETDFNSVANRPIPIRVRPDMDANTALSTMMYYVTEHGGFEDLETNNFAAYWIRTTWKIRKFDTKQVRTRIEIKRVPSMGDGLMFQLRIYSQVAAPDVPPTDEHFKDYKHLLKEYSRLSADIRNSVAIIE